MVEKLSGFFSPDGSKILSKNELKKADEALNKKSSSEVAGKTDSFSQTDTSVRNALGGIRAETFSQINEGATRAQSALDDVKSAKKLIRKEAKVLKNLAKAIKNGDTEKADKLKEKFNNLQTKRADLAEQVQRNNVERGGPTNIFVGNKSVSKFEVENVKVRRSLGEIDLDDPKSIREARKKLVTEDRAKLKEQASSLKQTLSDLGKVATQVETDFQSLIDADETSKIGAQEDFSKIKSIEEAAALSQDIASQITQAGAQSVLAHDINSSIESLLLS